jgi:hypothetical protein
MCARRREKRTEERVFSRTNITNQNSTNYNLDGTQLRPSKIPTPKQRKKIDEILAKTSLNKAKQTKMLIWDKSEVVWRTCWGTHWEHIWEPNENPLGTREK